MHAFLMTALLCAGQTPTLDNFDFLTGTLQGWDGSGFVLTGGTNGKEFAVTSRDEGSPSGKGMIRYVLRVPAGIGAIRFHAYAASAEGIETDHRLDVILAGAENRVVPKSVRSAAGWSPAPKLLGRWEGKPREYSWDVSSLGGQRFQIVLVDQDPRPGSQG